MDLMQIGSITCQIRRKAIKNLHISVMPPDGHVRISAPERMTETAIRTAVVSRIPWIKKQQKDFENQPRQSEREMVSGECHFLWGRRCRLKVIEQPGKRLVEYGSGEKLSLYVREGDSVERKAGLLAEFYRAELKCQIESLLPKWCSRGLVSPAQVGVRKMKTKWGSCNTDSKRIWLNLDLAKKPLDCAEYILVHELVHLLERNHNERFRQHMDRLLPDWRERRTLLNSLPLAHESWGY